MGTYRSKFQQKPLKWPTKSKPSEKSPKTPSPPNSPNSDKSSPPSKSPRSPLSLLPNSVINVVRKDIAKVLTVINQTRKAELQKLYRGKSIKPVDLKPRKTRALRKRLNKHEESLKSLKTIRREQKTALKNFALKA